MIVKMKFLSISGPRADIDRVCDVYLSKYAMQLENAITELRTSENLLPFVEVNPYKEPLARTSALLPIFALLYFIHSADSCQYCQIKQGAGFKFVQNVNYAEKHAVYSTPVEMGGLAHLN